MHLRRVRDLADQMDSINASVNTVTDDLFARTNDADTSAILSRILRPCIRVIDRLKALFSELQQGMATQPKRTALTIYWKQDAL